MLVSDGIDFSSLRTDGACGTTMACMGEHPARAYGANWASTVAPAEMVPSGA